MNAKGATLAAPASKHQKRYLFIDLYRGWAVLFMMETHVVNAWMNAGLRDTSWFAVLNIINGFVAPSFLFISGVSFIIIAKKRSEEMTHLTPALFRQLRRLLMILGIGYLLHLPRIVWKGIVPHILKEDLAGFYQTDVLQTIAVSLLILHLLFFATKTLERFVLATTVLAAMALFFTPWLWSRDFHDSLHPAIANYLNGVHNPLFPLFPWCVFVWAGAITAWYFFRDADSMDMRWGGISSVIPLSGLLLFAVGFLFQVAPVQLFHYESLWLAGPNWVLMRLGILLCLFSFFRLLETREWHTSNTAVIFGKESLFAYVAHLWLIFSVTGPKTRWNLFDRDQNAAMTAFLFCVVAASVLGLTLLWNKAKTRWALRKRS